jgi:hypothetical protein
MHTNVLMLFSVPPAFAVIVHRSSFFTKIAVVWEFSECLSAARASQFKLANARVRGAPQRLLSR